MNFSWILRLKPLWAVMDVISWLLQLKLLLQARKKPPEI
jgi:hypothetical protein